MGIIYIPKLLIEEELQRGELVEILPNAISRRYRTYAYFAKAATVPQKIRLLLEFLKNELRG